MCKYAKVAVNMDVTIYKKLYSIIIKKKIAKMTECTLRT